MDRAPAELRRQINGARGDPQLTPEEEGQLKEITEGVFAQHMDKCLREAGMSEDGRQRVKNFFREGMKSIE